MKAAWQAMLRTVAFVSKEIQAILVQPQLLMLLVAGPFLVLLAFGLGYRPQGPQLRTIVVQPAPEDPRQAISFYLSAVGPPLEIVQVTPDQDAAVQQLKARKVDLVAVVPPNVRETLLQGKNARFTFYHNAIDPAQIGYIKAVIDGATSQLNKAIAEQAVGEQQAASSDYEQVLVELQGDLNAIREALDSGDQARAQELARTVRLNSGLVASLWLFGAEPLSGGTAPALHLARQARDLDALVAAPDSQPGALDDTLGQVEDSAGQMLESLRHARQIPPDVFVAPLTWDAQAVSPFLPSYVAYHSPTVLALLVQHLCITLAALSLVDERTAGAIEVFRASPVDPREILMGKFAAYVLFIAVTTAALMALLIYGLRVPVLGDWGWVAAVLVGLVAYSLNLGFLISALARSRSQAIQMSMLVLLGSIFFSGFFVPLEDFSVPVRAISYSLPITYGMEELRQVVLRGERPDMLYLGIMGAWAAVLGFLSVRLFRRLFSTTF